MGMASRLLNAKVARISFARVRAGPFAGPALRCPYQALERVGSVRAISSQPAQAWAPRPCLAYDDSAAALRRRPISERPATIVDQLLAAAIIPPSTTISWPLTKLDPSLAR